MSTLSQPSQHFSNLLSKEKLSPELSLKLSRWQAVGFPHRRMEDWKYTTDFSWALDIHHIKHEEPETQTLSKSSTAKIKSHLELFPFHIVFYNGTPLSNATCLPVGMKFTKQKNIHRQNDNDPLKLLNEIVSNERHTITVQEKSKIASPVLLIHIWDDKTQGHYGGANMMLELEHDSQANFVELQISDHAQLIAGHNDFMSISLADSAILNFTRLAMFGSKEVSFHDCQAELSKQSVLRYYYLGRGARQVRQNLFINLNHELAELDVCGFYDLKNDEHHDFFFRANHLAPNTIGNYYIKGLLQQNAHAVFTGDVEVAREAQKTNAQLLNKNLILGNKAKVDTRPQMQVSADDVKAGHGATIGRLSDEEIFYLQSRGIPRAQAHDLLCQGFSDDIFLRLPLSIQSWVKKCWNEERVNA